MTRRQPRLFADPAPLTEAFERFWTVYPSRPMNPKVEARNEFFAQVTRHKADPEFIIRAARRFAERVAQLGTDPIYLPHARTWLSQMRFEDFPDPASAPASAVPAAPNADEPWRAALLEAMGADSYRHWAMDLRFEAGCLICPTSFTRSYLETHHGDRIRMVLSERLGLPDITIALEGQP